MHCTGACTSMSKHQAWACPAAFKVSICKGNLRPLLACRSTIWFSFALGAKHKEFWRDCYRVQIPVGSACSHCPLPSLQQAQPLYNPSACWCMFVDALHSPSSSGNQARTVCNRGSSLHAVLSTIPQGRPLLSPHRKSQVPKRQCKTLRYTRTQQLSTCYRSLRRTAPNPQQHVQFTALYIGAEEQLRTEGSQQRICAGLPRHKVCKMFLSCLAACLVVSAAPCTAAARSQVSTALTWSNSWRLFCEQPSNHMNAGTITCLIARTTAIAALLYVMSNDDCRMLSARSQQLLQMRRITCKRLSRLPLKLLTCPRALSQTKAIQSIHSPYLGIQGAAKWIS